jgi:predicted TIM-barrel fold metal-dependent hydrolase
MPWTRACARWWGACCASRGSALSRPSRRRVLWLLAGAAAGCAAPAARTPPEEVLALPLLDAHSHYVPPGPGRPGYSPEELVRAMDRAGIRRMVILGYGAREVPELAARYPDRFVPSYVGDVSFQGRQLRGQIRDGSDPREVEALGAEFEAALRSGHYRGLGEIHTYARPVPASTTGGAPVPGSEIPPDSPLIGRLLELSGRYGVPINIHCEDYAAAAMARAVAAHRAARVVWAHAGSMLPPAALGRHLDALPNLSFDLSTKNPACCPRGVREQPLAGAGGRLVPAWRALLEAYPDRFLFGVDFYSALHLARAREAGEYWRGLLAQLTPATARMIAFDNARRLYGLG